jgi:hypothetical protein
MGSSSEQGRLEHETVRLLLETKAVDFEAIGAAVAKIGPSVAIYGDGEDWFCGTMRTFVRLFRLPGPRGPVGDLGSLANVAGELRG